MLQINVMPRAHYPLACTVADPGFLEGWFWHMVACKFLEAMPTFGKNHAHFIRSWDKLPALSVQSICFERISSKVSHSSSFLSSVARKGVPFSLTSVYFLSARCSPKVVSSLAQRGVPVHPWIPLWIRHCCIPTIREECLPENSLLYIGNLWQGLLICKCFWRLQITNLNIMQAWLCDTEHSDMNAAFRCIMAKAKNSRPKPTIILNMMQWWLKSK